MYVHIRAILAYLHSEFFKCWRIWLAEIVNKCL